MTTQLSLIKILECSAVDEPAHGAPGWLVLKRAEGRLLKAVTGDAAPAEIPLKVVWSGSDHAVTLDDCPVVKVVKGSQVAYVAKTDIDPSAESSPAAHHSHAQPRALDGSGKFRRGLFRAANPRPRVGGKLFA